MTANDGKDVKKPSYKVLIIPVTMFLIWTLLRYLTSLFLYRYLDPPVIAVCIRWKKRKE